MVAYFGDETGKYRHFCLVIVDMGPQASSVSVFSGIRFFTDDCVVYRQIIDSSGKTALQNDLLAVQEWLKKRLVSLEVGKTSSISFHHRSNYAPRTYCLSNTAVPSCTSVKYLGIHISCSFTWCNHISHVTNAANCLLGSTSPSFFGSLIY